MIHNKISLIGRLGKDAVINVAGGKNVINFPLAVSDDKKQQDGTWKQETLWFDCAYWSDRTVEALKKGALVTINGTPRPHEYQKSDGSKGFSIRVTVEQMMVLTKANDATQSASTPQQAQQAPTDTTNYAQAAQDIEDNLPF